MKLLIVESPGKVSKLKGFLGQGWDVLASVGHVRDLPDKEIGVASPNFRPTYIPTERGRSVLAKLAKAVKATDEVYLATDPDREGEAIAWHLKDALKLKNEQRVTYAEITEKAVKAAIAKPRRLDMNLVAAQEARRVLDRLVGYLVPRPLGNLLGGKRPAGRVQSPALRLIVERERDIRDHRVTTHYGVELIFDTLPNISQGWKAAWRIKEWLKEGQEYILDKQLAAAVAAVRRVAVLSCKDSQTSSAPPAPFTTSTLQQAASNALKLSPKETMGAAQKLYEGGHITYMRTDSPNLSNEAVAEIQEFCRGQNWPVVAKPRSWKSKAGAQEAHEAIRPTHIEVEIAGETDTEKALYDLIRRRTLASQLEDALFAVREVVLQGDAVNGKAPVFEAKGRTLLKPGWKVVMAMDQTDESEEEPDNPVPLLQEGSQLAVREGTVLTKKTKPRPRYTEAALVKALENSGIGRPSTYAAILAKIVDHGYVRLEKRALVPTDEGEAVIGALVGKFAFLEYAFTQGMEQDLDAVAEGKAKYLDTIRKFYASFEKELQAFQDVLPIFPCPDCGKPLVHRVKSGPKGYDFWGCSGYPDCTANFFSDGDKPGRRKEKQGKPPLSEHKCPDCGKPLVHRVKESDGGYNFWGCSGFSRDGKGCRATFNDTDGKPGPRKEVRK